VGGGLNNSRRHGALYSELASLRWHLNMNAQYAGDQPNRPQK
jgi:hypothetical protein